MNKIEYIKGNALDWAEKDGYCMIHVCNNKGAFGGGKTALATQVKERFPQAYEKYMYFYEHEGIVCGTSSVVNLIAQDGYGARWKGVKYFREDWFESCLSDFLEQYKDSVVDGGNDDIHTIVVPYLMGADRAGGDWNWIINKVEKMLLPHFNILVVEFEG